MRAELRGPAGTPYEGGRFEVRLSLGARFPSEPPRGVFATKIFHPNVALGSGAICVNTLKKDWEPRLGLAHVLQVVRCLLIVPFPESALNDEAGRLFMHSYDEYARRARLWTAIHAKGPASDAAAVSDTANDALAASDAVNDAVTTSDAANGAVDGGDKVVEKVDKPKEQENASPARNGEQAAKKRPLETSANASVASKSKKKKQALRRL